MSASKTPRKPPAADGSEIVQSMGSLSAAHDLDIIDRRNPSKAGMGGDVDNQRIGPMWP